MEDIKLVDKEGKVRTIKEWKEWAEQRNYYLTVDNKICSNYMHRLIKKLEEVETKKWEAT